MYQRNNSKTFKHRGLGEPTSRFGGAKWRSRGAKNEVWCLDPCQLPSPLYDVFRKQATRLQHSSSRGSRNSDGSIKEPGHNQPRPGVNQNTLQFTVFRSSLQIEKRGGGSRGSSQRWITSCRNGARLFRIARFVFSRGIFPRAIAPVAYACSLSYQLETT